MAHGKEFLFFRQDEQDSQDKEKSCLPALALAVLNEERATIKRLCKGIDKIFICSCSGKAGGKILFGLSKRVQPKAANLIVTIYEQRATR